MQQLEGEIASLDPLPTGIRIEPHLGDCFSVLRKILDALHEAGKQLAPAFVFVDPYGFKVPGMILRELMEFPRVELFVNIIWRELDMAICQARKEPGSALWNTLNLVFDSKSWLSVNADSSDERAEQTLALYRELCEAQWATSIRMLSGSQRTRYILLHLTNHDAGRDLMKDCIWKVCPEGGFYARRSDNPDQQLLITPTPDLCPLENWVRAELGSGSRRWSDLTNSVRHQLWRPKHLNEVIRRLRQQGDLTGSNYCGNFAPKNDPLLTLCRGKSTS